MRGRRDRATRDRGGFTLAEVLIALAVVSLAAVSALHAITAAMRTVQASRQAEEIALRAEALAGQWRVDGYPRGKGEQGDFADRPDIRWSVSFRPARLGGVEGIEEASLTLTTGPVERSFAFLVRRGARGAARGDRGAGGPRAGD